MSSRLEDLEEILARIDLPALFDELGLPARHKMRACPGGHAQTGATPPVSLDTARGLWNCHSCGAGGRAPDLVCLAKGLNLRESIAWLRTRAGLPQPEPSPPGRPPRETGRASRPVPRPRPPMVDPSPPADAAEILAAFCAGRGWRLDVAQRCGLHVVTHLRPRRPIVRIPFRRERRTDWWQDREIGERLPKFDSPAGMSPMVWASDLDGALRCAHAEGLALVVEGPCDGIALAHYADPDGHPAVFALPGTGSSTALIRRLDTALAGLQVAVLVDEDGPGEKFRARLHQLLSSASLLIDVRVPAGAGDVDGWRRQLDLDDDALANAIADQVAAAVDRSTT